MIKKKYFSSVGSGAFSTEARSVLLHLWLKHVHWFSSGTTSLHWESFSHLPLLGDRCPFHLGLKYITVFRSYSKLSVPLIVYVLHVVCSRHQSYVV